jgi:lysophospholipase L1-like esterase
MRPRTGQQFERIFRSPSSRSCQLPLRMARRTLSAMVNTFRHLFRSSTLLWTILGLGLLVAGIREFRATVLVQEWESSVRAFERQDKIHPVPPGVIVFTGSSSIAYWSSLVDDMKPLTVINRGFGGSEYTDVDHYADRIVIAYRPAAVVVYAGDNDLASPGRKSAQSVAQDVQQFVQIVHAKLPQTWVFVLSIKPSILRWKAWPEMKQANQLIEGFLRTQDHAAYIDVASPMLDSSGRLSSDLFVSDGLHPSAKCYALWTSLIKPVLLQHFPPSKTSSRLPLPREASEPLIAGASVQ